MPRLRPGHCTCPLHLLQAAAAFRAVPSARSFESLNITEAHWESIQPKLELCRALHWDVPHRVQAAGGLPGQLTRFIGRGPGDRVGREPARGAPAGELGRPPGVWENPPPPLKGAPAA